MWVMQPLAQDALAFWFSGRVWAYVSPATFRPCWLVAVTGIVNLLGGHVYHRFAIHYVLADGSQGNGIPQLLPHLVPWICLIWNYAWDSIRTAACGILNGNTEALNLCSAPWCWMV